MTTIHDAYINALLADATYALNANGLEGLTGTLLKDALSSRMTPTLATYIGENFTVLTHIESNDNLGSGFDATVWHGNDGKNYVSMQGTQGLQDFITDLDLTISGAATQQIVDMVNWWLKNTTAEGQSAKQIQVSSGMLGIAPSTTGTGIITERSNIVVDGHSLGGHLATAFTRLFGGQVGWSIDHTYTYNSAGFTANSEQIFDQIEALLGSGVSKGYFEGLVGQSNFFAENGINVTTRTFLNGQEGLRTPLFNEESTGFPNHYMYKLTDALALGDAIAKLDSTFDTTKMSALFDKGANKTEESLERVLDALRQTILGNGVSNTAIGDVGDSADSRLAFHQNLNTLGNSDLFKAFAGKVEIVAPPTSASEARTDLGAFLSLFYLTHFTLKTDDAAAKDLLYTIHEPLSSKWNDDRNLNPEQISNGEANFSDMYLADRTHLLKALIETNQKDNDTYVAGTNTDNTDYTDSEKNITIHVVRNILVTPGSVPTVKVLFGDIDNNTLSGADKADHLYGMGGNDTLSGGDGDDYLEGNVGQDTLNGGIGNDTLIGATDVDILDGGTGNDQLKGGAGVDVYQFNGSYGTDIITDTDGQGFISINNTPANSGTLKLENIYKDDTTGYTFTKLNEGNTITITKENDPNRIIINDWSATHNLSLNLTGDTPTAPTVTLSGDFKKKIDDHGTTDTNDDTYVITNGNYTADETAPDGEANAPDLINGTDAIAGAGGKDVIDGKDGDDYLNGKSGDDYIEGGNGGDYIQGGLGKATLNGGDDVISDSIDADYVDGGNDFNFSRHTTNNNEWRIAA